MLCGNVQADDAYLGGELGELAGSKANQVSENKVPFVAAILLNAEGRPLYIGMVLLPGFTCKAVFNWATAGTVTDLAI